MKERAEKLKLYLVDKCLPLNIFTTTSPTTSPTFTNVPNNCTHWIGQC